MTIKRTIYIEISDLINFLYYEKRVTGIQRLVSQICWSFLNDEFQLNYKYCGLISESDNNFREFDRIIVYALIKKIIIGEEDIVNIVSILRDSSTILSYKKGDVILGTGASFSFKNYIFTIRKIKNKTDIIYGSIVYDLIPYYFSEGLPIELPKVFSLWLSELAGVSDLLISISEYTKKELTDFYINHGISLNKTKNINLPLASFPIKNFYESDILTRYNIENERYCLFVSTIETRKNHMQLLYVWDELLKSDLSSKAPLLVFVGKAGFGYENVIKIYNDNKILKEKVRFIHDASDDDLETLYKHCLFTIYPSLYEGWGLPITESLSRGKFCLSSNKSSLPEAGGVFAEYFDPENTQEILALVSKYAYTQDELKEKEKNIKNNYISVSWGEYACGLEKILLDTINIGYINKNNNILVNSGELYKFQYEFSYGETFQNFVKNRSIAYSMLNKGDWFIPEGQGRWSHGNVSSIKLQLKSTAKKINISLLYWLPVNLDSMKFSININGKIIFNQYLTNSDFGVRYLTTEVELNNKDSVDITFIGSNKFKSLTSQEPRDLLVALLAVGYSVTNGDRCNIIDSISEYNINKTL